MEDRSSVFQAEYMLHPKSIRRHVKDDIILRSSR